MMQKEMVEDTAGVLFTDGQNRVFFHPLEAYSDGQGFHHKVDLAGGPFGGTIDASSYERVRTLRSFHQQLVALYTNLSGEADLPSSYENLKLSLKGDGLGHIAVAIQALAGTCLETRLSFQFVIDQTQLSAIISAFRKFCVSDLQT